MFMNEWHLCPGDGRCDEDRRHRRWGWSLAEIKRTEGSHSVKDHPRRRCPTTKPFVHKRRVMLGASNHRVASTENAVQVSGGLPVAVPVDPEVYALGVGGHVVVPGDTLAVPPAGFNAFRVVNQFQGTVVFGIAGGVGSKRQRFREYPERPSQQQAVGPSHIG